MADFREVIASDAGFEIIADGDQIMFANRRTLAPAVATWVTGGLGFLFVVNGAVQGAMAASGRSLWAIAIGLGAAGVVMIFVATRVFRVYRGRRDTPVEQIANRLTAHTRDGDLRDASGNAVTRLDTIRVVTGVDVTDHSRGLMRTITLKWPKGSRRIFKTNGKEEIERVVGELARRGIGTN